MKKITKSTFKSFLKKNEGKLFIQSTSDFDCMSDCVRPTPENEQNFTKLNKKTISEMDYIIAKRRGTTPKELEDYIFNSENTLGYHGIWLVNGSNNYFSVYKNSQYHGISVYNCCGSFIVAIAINNIAEQAA